MENKSKLNTILLAIIIILLVIVLVYIFSNNSKQENQTNVPVVNSNISIQSTGTDETTSNNSIKPSAPVVATNLKTYLNSQYHFQIQYPNEVDVNDDYPDGVLKNALSLTVSNTKYNSPSDYLTMMITSPSYTGGRQDCTDGWDNNKYTHISINGIDFIKGDISSGYQSMNHRDAVATGYCFTSTNGNQYFLTDVGTPSSVITNIINSFKFTK